MAPCPSSCGCGPSHRVTTPRSTHIRIVAGQWLEARARNAHRPEHCFFGAQPCSRQATPCTCVARGVRAGSSSQPSAQSRSWALGKRRRSVGLLRFRQRAGDDSHSQVSVDVDSKTRNTSQESSLTRDGGDWQQEHSSPSNSGLGSTGASTEEDSNSVTSWLAPLGLVGGVVLLVGGGYVFKSQIGSFLDFFIKGVDDWGPLGPVAYAVVYTGLEVLAVPAVPLTMTGGVIFGPVMGTLVVSVSATAAATLAFLISRYLAREKISKWAKKNPKFAAIDRAIGKDGFKIVTLLRLSPLLPLSLSNYMYGLTSVDLGPYVAASFLGMLPGTYAYVSAGHLGKAVFLEGEGSLPFQSWQVAAALGITLVTLAIVGQTAKKALKEVDEDAA